MSAEKPFVFRLKRNTADIQHNQFRIEGRYCDVTIVVQEKEFLAHRSILASCSEFFENMLKPGTTEYDTGMIHLHEEWMEADTFEDFLQIAYLGEVTITDENCQALCKMAHFLMFKEMLEVTEDYIGQRIDTDNFFQLVEFAHLHELKLLNKQIINFLFRNFQDLTALVQFLELSFDCLKFIVSGNKKHGQRNLQEDLFLALLKWIEHDVNNRSVHIFELLSIVQQIHLSGKFLRTEVAQNELILNSFECCKLFLVQTLTQRQIRSSIIPSLNEGVIYAIGGNSFSASIYDPLLNKWILLPNFLEEARSISHAVFHLNRILMFGGTTYRGGVQNQLNSVQRIRLTGSNRQPKTVMSSMNTSEICSVAVFEDRIYVSGKNNSNEKLFAVLQWNSEEQSYAFSPVTMMNSTAIQNRLVALGNYLYSLGGVSNYSYVKTVERYCPRSDKWIDMPDMNHFHKNFFQAVSLNEKLYVYSYEGFEMFNPEAKVWTVLPAPNKKENRTKFVACSGKLYLIGGTDSRTVEEFDPNTRQWSFRAEMDQIRNDCAIVVVDL